MRRLGEVLQTANARVNTQNTSIAAMKEQLNSLVVERESAVLVEEDNMKAVKVRTWIYM